jgi:hypothetical protein
VRFQEITINKNGEIVRSSGSLIPHHQILNRSAIDLFSTVAAISDMIGGASSGMNDIVFNAVNGENLLGRGYYDFSFSFTNEGVRLVIEDKSTHYEHRRNLQQKRYDQLLGEENS